MNNLVLQQSQDGMNRAVLSDDGVYRYSLSRRWPAPPGIVREPKVLPFVMLNPSTADDLVNDRTISRCIGFANFWRYDRLIVVNTNPMRSTDPKRTPLLTEANASINDQHLLAAGSRADMVVCAWGANVDPELERRALKLLAPFGLFCLALTKGGKPRHPLYLPSNLIPSRWELPPC